MTLFCSFGFWVRHFGSMHVKMWAKKARYSPLNSIRTKTQHYRNTLFCADCHRIHSEYFSRCFVMFIMQFIFAVGSLVSSTSLCVSLLGIRTYYGAFTEIGATQTLKTNQMQKHFQIRPIKRPVENNEISTCSLWSTTVSAINCQIVRKFYVALL